MKNKITDIDLRSPEYKGFWMDLLPPKKNPSKRSKKQ